MILAANSTEKYDRVLWPDPNVEKDLVADVQSRYRQPVENQVGKSQLAVSRTFAL